MSDSTMQEARFDLREALRDVANKIESKTIDDDDILEAVLTNLANFERKIRKEPYGKR